MGSTRLDARDDLNRLSLMGNVFAMVISWSQYQSVAWTFLHSFFGWFYVLYHAYRVGQCAGAIVGSFMVLASVFLFAIVIFGDE